LLLAGAVSGRFEAGPFHLLASEGAVHTNKDHLGHLQTLARICTADEALFLATPYRVVNVTDAESQASGVRWWEELTGQSGEGRLTAALVK